MGQIVFKLGPLKSDLVPQLAQNEVGIQLVYAQLDTNDVDWKAVISQIIDGGSVHSFL